MEIRRKANSSGYTFVETYNGVELLDGSGKHVEMFDSFAEAEQKRGEWDETFIQKPKQIGRTITVTGNFRSLGEVFRAVDKTLSNR